MPIRLVTPTIAVNTDFVESVIYEKGGDPYHVEISTPTGVIHVGDEYSLEEIMAALEGKCYYRAEWCEMVGTIDICVLHNNNSRHERNDPFRLCNSVDPETSNWAPHILQPYPPPTSPKGLTPCLRTDPDPDPVPDPVPLLKRLLKHQLPPSSYRLK